MGASHGDLLACPSEHIKDLVCEFRVLPFLQGDATEKQRRRIDVPRGLLNDR